MKEGDKISFVWKCPECTKRNEIELTIDDLPEGGSFDYPGSGAQFSPPDEGEPIECSWCRNTIDWDEFDMKYNDDIQRQIGESMADQADAYDEGD